MAPNDTSTTTPPSSAEQPQPADQAGEKADGAAEQETKEPTISEKLQAKFATEAVTFNKLRGITEASFHIEKAIEWLTKGSGFESTHSDVVSLNAVLVDLGTYA